MFLQHFYYNHTVTLLLQSYCNFCIILM
jgi:hypothetical protein